jgi:ABC-2 type transport system ATP-binding protein
MKLTSALSQPNAAFSNEEERSPTLMEVRNLSKTFGAFRAVNDISFALRAGEIVGLLGANGAGKSTTIHMLLGLITPTMGTITFFGRDLRRYRENIFGRINYTSPYAGFPSRLNAQENLMVYVGLYQVRNGYKKVRDLLDQFGLMSLAKTSVARFSSGEVARLRLCKAFLNEPELLLLDEPTANLDPVAAQEVKKILIERQKRDGLSILLASHNMAEVEQLCDRVLFMNAGEIVADGTPLEVTCTILRENRTEPSLEEVFIRIGKR